MNRLAAMIKMTRKEVGLSQKELAEILEVSPRTITNYESGKTIPESRVLAKMIPLLKLDLTSNISAPQDSFDPYVAALNSACKILSQNSPYSAKEKQQFIINIVQYYISISSEHWR